MQIFKKPHFNFMKYKLFAFGLSGIIIIVGIINITKGKGLNEGIDFAGGSLVRVMLKNEIPIDEVRRLLSEVGLEKSQITEIDASKREYMIRSLLTTGKSQEEEIEAHEIIGNKVIEALRLQEDKAAL
ncbi:MAG TPA: protein translocase subunit SecF, partial [Candidatus Aminicenantes bacterium]|nr:protein translocase subunit SecF [Candidatus Aminicenantes bacterium]